MRLRLTLRSPNSVDATRLSSRTRRSVSPLGLVALAFSRASSVDRWLNVPRLDLTPAPGTFNRRSGDPEKAATLRAHGRSRLSGSHPLARQADGQRAAQAGRPDAAAAGARRLS